MWIDNFLRFLGIAEATNDRNVFIRSIHIFEYRRYKKLLGAAMR